MKYQISIIFALSVLMLFGCDTEDPHTPQQVDAYIQAWAPTVSDTLTQRSEGASVKKELTRLIDGAAAADEAKTTRDEPAFHVFVKESYAADEYKSVLVRTGALTPAGEAIWKQVQQVEDHALDPAKYPLEDVQTRMVVLEKLAGGFEGGDLSPNDAEQAFVRAWLTTKTPTEFALTTENHEKLTDRLLESPEASRLTGVMADYTKLGAEVAAESAAVEHLLAYSLARFSYEMRHANVRTIFIHPRHDDYYNDPEIRQQNKRPIDAKAAYKAGTLRRRVAKFAESIADHTKAKHNRVRKTLTNIRKAEEPDKLVAALRPMQPQYERLLKIYKEYREIDAAGGWEKVAKARKLGPGKKSETVSALKKRLQTEGYYPKDGATDQHYDKALEDAVRSYQETHQMEVTGKPHNMFWRSLNVPAERRLSQIELNVKRWRYSNIRHDEDEIYVFINVPDFTAEVWEEGERKMRFAVIVGNNDLVEQEEDEPKVRANRTPVPLTAFIDRAIYNPFWNVTPRVRKNEILPEVNIWLKAKYDKMRGIEPTVPPVEGEKKTTAPAQPPASAPTNAPPPMLTLDAPVPKVALTQENFPYMNLETGEVDASTTIPENIPGWYATENYEVMHAGKKWEYVRMTPGKHNALGLVKVIFPNLHDVYLHDTNARALFTRPIRAFSHGCMRMHNPLDFAEFLLKRDGVYDEKNIPKINKDGSYLPVFLKRQVPVFVEYYTVRIDNEGRPHFLADTYDYDDNPRVPEPAVRKASL